VTVFPEELTLRKCDERLGQEIHLDNVTCISEICNLKFVKSK